MATALGGPPPEGAMRADVTAFAGPVGAYTILRPVRIAISSTDVRHQGTAAVESLFHEAGHALVFRLARELRTALEEAGKPGHDDLWHALLFFTAGEVVKWQMGPDHVPYAKAQHPWERMTSDGTLYLASSVAASDLRDEIIERVPLLPGRSAVRTRMQHHEGFRLHRVCPRCRRQATSRQAATASPARRRTGTRSW
jgi:hypothetical protein